MGLPKRSEKRDAAKAEYIAKMAQGMKVNLKELAGELGVTYQTLRNWKTADEWEKALPPRKRGGQPGNKNSKGKKNAKGSHPGAPAGNKNAEKDGAYSTVFFDTLTEEEKAELERVPLEARAALEQEMKILKFRESRILAKIAEYEKADPDELYINSAIWGDMEMQNRDSAFARVLKLQEALYKVHGRIATVADRLRAMDEHNDRLSLEQQRLDIMRLRATGVVNVDEPEDMENEELNAQLKATMEEKQAILGRLGALQQDEEQRAGQEARLRELAEWLKQQKSEFAEYDDSITRRYVERITVVDAETIRIKFRYTDVEIDRAVRT